MRNEYNLFIRPEEVFQLIAVDFGIKITGKFTHNVYTYCPLNGNYNNIITQVSKNISGKYVLFRRPYNFACLSTMHVYMVRVVLIYIFAFNSTTSYILKLKLILFRRFLQIFLWLGRRSPI